jgi:predicted RNase H-like HicB family nuclease
MAPLSFTVVVERDESGAWIARIPSIRGCHSYGRTLEQARARIREALELWVDDAGDAELRFDIRLPARTKDQIRHARNARTRSVRAQREASTAVRRAAATLTGRLGLSRRDAAELLGVSHQRVQQLLSSTD